MRSALSSVLDVDAGNWRDQVTHSKDLVLVEFWHRTCPWCRLLGPIYGELSDEYRGKVKFARLNMLESTENKFIAATNGVLSTPTLVFYCEGRPLGSLVGFIGRDSLKQAIEQMLVRHKQCIEQSSSLIDYV